MCENILSETRPVARGRRTRINPRVSLGIVRTQGGIGVVVRLDASRCGLAQPQATSS